MGTPAQTSFQARKMPVQARSIVTVEAIHEATIQVLLALGAARLTTIRVAERAGVSVGTLYQYYPNKQALLFAVLERHLHHVTEAVEGACTENHHQPVRVMVESLVHGFVDAKLQQREAAVALYHIASGLDGDKLVAKVRKRLQRAAVAMFSTARPHAPADVDFAVFLFLAAMAGAIREVLEQGAHPAAVKKLREQLVVMGRAYLAKR